mmetsp:Transcript_45144/g.88319  ORF Transcript_45144/g.88319 Transcript_45144/m.88319 type:complete len:157 (+) Transcript_45144:189-659(+)
MESKPGQVVFSNIYVCTYSSFKDSSFHPKEYILLPADGTVAYRGRNQYMALAKKAPPFYASHTHLGQQYSGGGGDERQSPLAALVVNVVVMVELSMLSSGECIVETSTPLPRKNVRASLFLPLPETPPPPLPPPSTYTNRSPPSPFPCCAPPRGPY